MHKSQEKENDPLRKKAIELRLREVPAETLIGKVIQRVLSGESEFDFNSLLRNLISQAEVDENAVNKILGNNLLKEIRLYVSGLPNTK